MQRGNETLARWIQSLAEKIANDQNRYLYEKDGQVYFADPGNTYALELRKLSSAVLEGSRLEHKLSSDYVQQRIYEVLLRVIDNSTSDNDAPALLEHLFDSLDAYDERRTVYLAVSGIEMTDVDELRFGEVVLKKMTDAQTAEIIGRLDTEKDRKKFLDRVRSVPFAEIVVWAEPIKAWEIAVDRVRAVLDLLRYSMPFLSDENLDPDISLLGQNRFSPPLVAVHGREVEDLFGSFQDLPTSLEISKEAVSKMEDAGFFEAAGFAGKEDKTQLERKVLRGIQWASDSQGQREPDNKLLSLIIALECLLPSLRSSGSGSWTSEGAALLLGRDLKSRRAVRNRILGLYKKRNNIVHGGEGEKITSKDVIWLRKTVHELIRTIIRRRSEFESSHGDYTIAIWLEDRKLAGGTV